MNQPIPRSFFKDGQRAKRNGRKGTIFVVQNEVGIEYEDVKAGESLRSILILGGGLSYDYDDLELLDRTIDQVMEGDYVRNRIWTKKVIARVGEVVAFQINETDVEWKTIDMLKKEEFNIIQPNTKEVMTDETAKALREECLKNYIRPNIKTGQVYKYWEVSKNYVATAQYNGDSASMALMAIGNFFHNTPAGYDEAKRYGTQYAPAFLHQFKE